MYVGVNQETSYAFFSMEAVLGCTSCWICHPACPNRLTQGSTQWWEGSTIPTLHSSYEQPGHGWQSSEDTKVNTMIDPKVFWAAYNGLLLISKPAYSRAGAGCRRKASWQEYRCILDAKQKLICFTTAAPEKINFDTELPLYKQITILSNNLICAKPTENSLKNQ